jgi:hypothetical protein
MRAAPFGLLAAMLAAAGISATAEAAPRAVVELFTSQGCSSCPPADELLAKLALDPNVIALSLPVDYWDRLGWKDTLARHAFTERQEAYADVRGDGQVYTPQAVVNGREHAVGSERSAIERAAAATTAGLDVPLQIEPGSDGIVISVGAAPGTPHAQGEVVLLPFYASRDVAIGRGENARRKVTYTNVVGDIRVVSGWTGAAVKQSVPAAALKGYDGVVVLLQEGSVAKPGAILGAARVALR